MKKRFLLLAMIIFAGICFSSLQDNSLKACDANAKAGASAIKKKNMRQATPDFVEDQDASVNIFMNPFTQL